MDEGKAVEEAGDESLELGMTDSESDEKLVGTAKVDSELMTVDEATDSDSVLELSSTEVEVLDSVDDDSVDDGCAQEMVEETGGAWEQRGWATTPETNNCTARRPKRADAMVQDAIPRLSAMSLRGEILVVARPVYQLLHSLLIRPQFEDSRLLTAY